MRKIPLRRHDGTIRDYALVDDSAYDDLNRYRWHLTSHGYAERSEYRSLGIVIKISMHRQILDLLHDPRWGEHKNRNRLDNRRLNLRVASGQADNQQNQPIRKDNTSGYRGVSWGREVGKWRAYANFQGRQHTIGWYQEASEADAAVKVFRAKHMPFSEDASDYVK